MVENHIISIKIKDQFKVLKGDGYINGHKLWSWLKRNNFPPGFRILCQRCNVLDGYLRNSPFGVSGIDKLIELVKNNENK